MKCVEESKTKKPKHKKKVVVKPKKGQVLIVAQEIKFARSLSSNEKKTRDRALKSLKKWLLNCFQKGYVFKESDFTRLWKGLFYAMWMSDKALVQEELCENISGLLDQFPPERLEEALLLVHVGWLTLATEWYGIDHHRMDKTLMLVRRYLRGSLRCLRRSGWSLESCQMYSAMMGGKRGILALKTPQYARNATSMIMHVTDCYLEELAKVSQGEIPLDSMAELLRPFCAYTCGGEAPALCVCSRRVLSALVRQSAPGMEYRQRTRAWEKMGCPEGGPAALELVSDDEGDYDPEEEGSDNEDSSSKPLDPRAGRVDVELPLLPVPCAQLVAMLRTLLTTAGSKAHKRGRICLQRFEKLAANEYPLPAAELPPRGAPLPRPARSARELLTLEKRLATTSDELALRGLSRKHRKRLLAKSRSGHSIVEDVSTINVSTGDWHVEETEPVKKKKKLNDSPRKDVSEKKKRPSEVKHSEKVKKQKNGKINGISNNLKKGNTSKIDVSKEGRTKVGKSSENVVNKSVGKVNKIKSDPKTTEKVVNGVEKVNKNKPAVVKTAAKLVNGVAKGNKNEPQVLKTNRNDQKAFKATKAETKKEKTVERTEKSMKVEKHLKKVEKHSKKVEKHSKKAKTPAVVVSKVRRFQKQLSPAVDSSMSSPKKVKFVLKNNSMQGAVEYYKSVRQSPSIPFDSSKVPSKTNLKVSTPSPINPFFKKKLRLK